MEDEEGLGGGGASDEGTTASPVGGYHRWW
jgi:hypothetical protein